MILRLRNYHDRCDTVLAWREVTVKPGLLKTSADCSVDEGAWSLCVERVACAVSEHLRMEPLCPPANCPQQAPGALTLSPWEHPAVYTQWRWAWGVPSTSTRSWVSPFLTDVYLPPTLHHPLPDLSSHTSSTPAFVYQLLPSPLSFVFSPFCCVWHDPGLNSARKTTTPSYDSWS